MFELQTPDFIVASKSGLFAVDLQEERASTLQVGTLRQRIRERPEYSNPEGWHFLGPIDNADGEELVSQYVDVEKKEKIVIARSWKSWHGTFLEERIKHHFPRLSPIFVHLIQFLFSLAFVGLIIGFSKASFYLPGKDVPYTLQTLGVFLTSFFLGLYSVVTMGLYLIIGDAGGKVFAGNQAGSDVLFHSYTSGFLWGFFITSFIVGLLVSWRGWDRNVYTWFLATCIGWITTFLPGLSFFAAKVNWNWNLAVKQALVPFLPAEAVKFMIILITIPLLWFATSRTLNMLDSRIAGHTSLKNEIKSFFHPKFVSF